MGKARATANIKSEIALAVAPSAIERCHPVMLELRPLHSDLGEFVRQVQRQHIEGFQLAYLEAEGEVRSVAGFRIIETLFGGLTLYLDDLVTRARDRSRGFGAELFDWLAAHARDQGCAILTLDSGVQRFGAHRFYLAKRMKIAAHHFTLEL